MERGFLLSNVTRIMVVPRGKRRKALRACSSLTRTIPERGFLLSDVVGTMVVPHALGCATIQELVRKSGADEQAEPVGAKAARHTRRYG